MNKKMLVYLISVLIAPLVFYIYWINNLVCLPRAIFSSAIFGIIPLLVLFSATKFSKEWLFNSTLLVLLFEMVITPVIMLKRLGWDMFVTQRLLAFFSFEGFAFMQLILCFSLLKEHLYIKKKNNF